MLRLHLLEAENLVAKDNMMGGMVKGKSDPYAKIQIGNASFKSHVIKEKLNPVWNEMYEVRSSHGKCLVVYSFLKANMLVLHVFPSWF